MRIILTFFQHSTRKSYIRQLPYGYIIRDSVLREAVRAASRLSMVSRSGLCVHTPDVSLHSREHSNSLHPGDIYPGYVDHRRLSPGVLTIASTVLPDVENNSRLLPGAYTVDYTILPGTLNDRRNINASVTLPGEANMLDTDTSSTFETSAGPNEIDEDPHSTKNVTLHSATQLDVISIKSIDSSQEVASNLDNPRTEESKLDLDLVNKQYTAQGGDTSGHAEAPSVPLAMSCGLTELSTAQDEGAQASVLASSQDDGSPNEKAEVASHIEESHSGKQTNRSRYTTISSVDTASTMTTVTA